MQKGDKVRVIAADANEVPYQGNEGVIARVVSGWEHPYAVKFGPKDTARYKAEELELVS